MINQVQCLSWVLVLTVVLMVGRNLGGLWALLGLDRCWLLAIDEEESGHVSLTLHLDLPSALELVRPVA